MGQGTSNWTEKKNLKLFPFQKSKQKYPTAFVTKTGKQKTKSGPIILADHLAAFT